MNIGFRREVFWEGLKMEIPMYSIGSLRTMEVIDLSTGTRLGFIKDLVIDCDNYKIISITLPSQKVSFFGKNDDIEIPWEKVNKVGLDVILVDGSDLINNDK